MPRNPDLYEKAECPQCQSPVFVSLETLTRATTFQVQCENCRMWLRATTTPEEKPAVMAA